MKRLFFLFVLIVFAFDSTEAQTSWSPTPSAGDIFMQDEGESAYPTSRSRKRGKGSAPISGGISNLAGTYNMPLGSLAEGLNPAFGVVLDNMSFFGRFGIGVHAGVHFFKYKEDTIQSMVAEKTWYSIPMMLQGLYVFGEEDLMPYVGLAGGVAWNTDHVMGSTTWTISPVGGVFYRVGNDFYLTACLRLEKYMTAIGDERERPQYITANAGIAWAVDWSRVNSMRY